MDYQTGTISTSEQLLDAIRIFMTGHGWNSERWEDIANNNKMLSVSYTQGDIDYCAHFKTVTDEQLNYNFGYHQVTGIFCTLSAGNSGDPIFDISKTFNEQPNTIRNSYGVTDACGLYRITNTTTYHFIKSLTCIFIIIEPEPGIFYHLGIGNASLENSDSTNNVFLTASFGGDDFITSESTSVDYVFGSTNDRFIGIPFNDTKYYGQSFFYTGDVFDANDNTSISYNSGWLSFCLSNPRTGRIARSIFFGENPKYPSTFLNVWNKCSPNTLAQITPFYPYQIFVDADNGFFRPYGYIMDLLYVNMTDYDPLQTVIFKGYKYMIFPAHSKNNKSGLHGYAILYDTQ